jgi:uncharacterized alkaline shock family protein YloU
VYQKERYLTMGQKNEKIHAMNSGGVAVMEQKSPIQSQEFQLPETTFEHTIENKVFQEIIMRCLSEIPGVSLLEGGFIDHILGRADGIAGIHTEQDTKNCSLHVKVEVNIDYGVSIPEKAEQIQEKIVRELGRLTGLHVASVSVVFKHLIPRKPPTPVSE